MDLDRSFRRLADLTATSRQVSSNAQTWKRFRGILAYEASPLNPRSPEQQVTPGQSKDDLAR
jgi:hypothetical protein